MGTSNGKITAPVSIEDVSSTLGVGNYDLGYLCANSHGKINPWARYKPVVYSKMAPTATEKWWQANDGNCGIVPKNITHYSDSVNWADGSMNGWRYMAPTGKDFSPFRLLDFDGYNHKAEAPLFGFSVPTSISNQFPNSGFVAACGTTLTPEGGSLPDYLHLGDLLSIKDCYFGVYVKQRNGSQARRATASTPIGKGTTSARIKTYGMPTGTWDVYPFICTAILEQDAIDVANSCYTVPLVKSASINIISSYISITLLPMDFPKKAGDFIATIRVRNTSSSGITFRNNGWKMRFYNKEFLDVMMAGETYGKIDDFSIGGNETKDVLVTASITQTLVDAGTGRFWVSLDSANYIMQGMFLQQLPDPEI